MLLENITNKTKLQVLEFIISHSKISIGYRESISIVIVIKSVHPICICLIKLNDLNGKFFKFISKTPLLTFESFS